jgi:hypothetical protein
MSYLYLTVPYHSLVPNSSGQYRPTKKMWACNAHPAEAHPGAEALGGRAVRLQEVAQRQTGQLMEAGGLGRFEEACECQLQPAMHPTYVATLNTRHQ